MKNFCIIILSHADTIEKEEVLTKSILSIKKTGLKIILISHIPVNIENQKLCDYFIKDDDNLVLKESDIFSNPVEIGDNLFTMTDVISNITFDTAVFKTTYQPGCLNLYINSFKFAKQIGFDNAILWEYDYEIGENSLKFIENSIIEFNDKNLDSLTFTSIIKTFNNDIVVNEIKCCHAIPAFFNIDKILSILPDNSILNAKEYNKITNLRILENWIYEELICKNIKKIEIDYSDIHSLLPDIKIGSIHTQLNSYLFYTLRSGIYFNIDKDPCLFLHNMSNVDINYEIEISNNNNIIYYKSITLHNSFWAFDYLDIKDKLNSDDGCVINEIVKNLNNNKVDTFTYTINNVNLEFISKLKKYRKNELENI